MVMDQIVELPTPALIPLDLIDPDPGNVRRTAASEREDEQLATSLTAQGQIQPVVLRQAEGGRYTIVAGARRVRAATSIGWPAINAIVSQADELQAKAIQAAENAHRVQMHPIDVWQAMVALQSDGMSLKAAAQCLGVSDRRARQLDRLGRIAEPLIEAMRANGIPDDSYLAAIAAAPLDAQERAFKKHARGKSIGHWIWHDVSSALRTRSLSQKDAIFDITKAPDVVWQEDVFAEPDSRGVFTTENIDGFLAHQRQALADQVAARKKKGQSVEFVTWDAKQHGPVIPPGYLRSWDSKPRSMKLPPDDPRLLILAVNPHRGDVVEALVVKRGKKQATSSSTSDIFPGDREVEADDAVASSPRPMTNAGLQMVAAAQTEAIRARLDADGPGMRIEMLLRLLCLAVCSDNVTVRRGKFANVSMVDIRSKLMGDDGGLVELGDIKPIAAELVARMLFADDPVTGFGSGRTAMAIGVRIGANEKLRSFDSADFLKTLSATQLKEAAAAVGITDAKTSSVLRTRLEGKIGNKWVPEAAEFALVALSKDEIEDQAAEIEDEAEL